MEHREFEPLLKAVGAARHAGTPLAIEGGGTRKFYGREIVGEPFSLADCRGIVDYHPTELVVTVRAGTRVDELEQELNANGQMLGFEPPVCAPGSTIGGSIALGFSGSARPYRGNVQDFVLGIRLLTGDGRIMRFGGQVIKNVAGFDVARLMVGSLGCLGIILEVSLKVIPRPQCECTLCLDIRDVDRAISRLNELAGQPYPITAASWLDGVARVRLSGSEAGVDAAAKTIGGTKVEDDPFWHQINSQKHRFFSDGGKIKKVSQKPSVPVFAPDRPVLVDWGGALRWYREETGEAELKEIVAERGGWLELFCNADRAHEVLAFPNPAAMRIQHRLKDVFDPDRILNPGRMYGGL